MKTGGERNTVPRCFKERSLEMFTVFLEKLNQFGNQLPGNISQGLIWGIMAIGVYITYKILDFPDLSVDGSIGTGGAIAVILIGNGVPVWLALVCAFAAGCLAGLVTGLLNTLLGIPGILAGILTQIALYSVNLVILGGSNKSISVDKFPLLLSSRRIAVREGFAVYGWEVGKCLIIVALIIAALYWFFGTEYGFTIRATGCNSHMSRAQGINTKKSTVIALVLSNGLVGLCGGLLSQYQGFADINMGRGAIVIGLAAVIIGDVIGSAIFGKRFNFIARLAFTCIGAIIYYIVLAIVMLIGLDTTYNKLFSAVVVAIFLAVPYIRRSMKTSYRRAARRAAMSNGAVKIYADNAEMAIEKADSAKKAFMERSAAATEAKAEAKAAEINAKKAMKEAKRAAALAVKADAKALKVKAAEEKKNAKSAKSSPPAKQQGSERNKKR